MRRWGFEGPTRCWCCTNPTQETITHVFLRSPLANRTWSYFGSSAGVLIEELIFRETILAWWNEEVRGRF